MKRIFGAALICVFGFVAQASHAAWNADWPHSVRINLNTTAEGANLATAVDSVPVLVRLHTGNFDFPGAKPDGSDLRFIAADDKTPLKYHIEKFDSLTELALVWVLVPKIAPNAKTDFITLYYGNPKATAGDDPKASYDAAQSVVLHFNDKDGAPKDVSANANNAASFNGTYSGGLIDGGASFDGSARLTIAASPSTKLSTTGTTVSMWVRAADLSGNATLFSQQEGSTAVSLSLKGDKLVAQLGVASATASTALTAAVWHHVAMTIKETLTVYLDGVAVGSVAAPATTIGGEIAVGQGLRGDLDEFEFATTARSADWIKAAALSQGENAKLATVAPAEAAAAEEGVSYFKILLGSVTLDGWVVIGILMVMMVISVLVMVTKTMFINRTVNANERFKRQFAKLMTDLTALDNDAGKSTAQLSGDHGRSSLYRIYHVGVEELRQRIDSYRAKGRELILSDQSINAIRASLDAGYVRESQRLNSQMVLLTIAIAGGPFLGLLGTVVGVMITFAAIAAAGDVNVNAIAPGIAAALVATVAGLAVAIPSLFGYNYLASKIKEVSSDMQVFVDEFVTKLAENYSV